MFFSKFEPEIVRTTFREKQFLLKKSLNIILNSDILILYGFDTNYYGFKEMKVFIRIVIYTCFALLTAAMLWIGKLDTDLYDTKISKDTIQLFNPNNGKYLFLKTWQEVKQSYYDPEMNRQDWQRWKDRYLDQVNSTDDAIVAINTMLSSLNDPYSIFMDKEEFQEQMNQIDSKINGIGVHISVESGKIVIFSVMEGSPAEKAGLKNNDIIINVDGKDTQGLSIQSVAGLIRGKKGSVVEVTVLRGNEKITKKITRDEIKIENLTYKLIDGYAYINLRTFIADTVSEEFDEAIAKAKKDKAKGYIIDLRNNTGGLLGNAIYIANLFLEQGDIVLIVDRNGAQSNIAAKYSPEAIKEPLVILINPMSASASEILCGALKDNGRAVLVGETTFGKGLVQKVYTMPNSMGMNLTISRYLTPNGTDIHKKGIAPDYNVKITEESVKKGEDVQLKKALEVIKKMK